LQLSYSGIDGTAAQRAHVREGHARIVADPDRSCSFSRRWLAYLGMRSYCRELRGLGRSLIA
jgi:hypothetical protein